VSAYGERIARVEVEVQELRKAFEEHKDTTNKRFEEISSKLDALLALRNNGAGVVWLVSGLMGTGVIATILEVLRHIHIWSK
jgi:hypothetical protein